MSMIYTLVAREKIVLTDYTSFSGNFSQVALEVLNKSYRSLGKQICLKLLDNMSLLITLFILSSRRISYFWLWSNQLYIFFNSV